MYLTELIKGGAFSDERGILHFFNDFDMSPIVRMYEIAPKDTVTIRAWQAHKLERKWFYCTAGSFIINSIPVDSFEKPSTEISVKKVTLTENIPNVLQLPGGHASGIKALQADSKLMVFSNFTVSQSKKDDYRFEKDYWTAEWTI